MPVISLQQTIAYAKQAGFTGTALQTIVAIAKAESGLDTSIVNSIGATGILQILLSAHPDVTPSQAKDPAFSFRYAFKLSGGGKNFCPWQSYDSQVCGLGPPNGWDDRYKQYMAEVAQALNSSPARSAEKNTILSVKDIPNSTGKPAWWMYARIDNLGQPDPFGGVPKPDSNIQLPDGYPIITLLPGTVTAIDTSNVAWGGVVTLKLDIPLNKLATHMQFEHLARTPVRVGQHLNPGDILGFNGGSLAQGTQKVPLGVGLYHGDHYGVDAGWQFDTPANLNGGPLDIVPLLNAARDGTLTINLSGKNISISGGAEGSSGQQFLTSVLSTGQQAHDILNNFPGFAEICEAVDIVEQFVPFALPTKSDNGSGSTDINIFGIDTGIPDPGVIAQKAVQLPSDIIQAIFVFSVTNLGAFLVRSMFVILGIILLVALMINMISKQGIDVGDTAGNVATLAAV